MITDRGLEREMDGDRRFAHAAPLVSGGKGLGDKAFASRVIKGTGGGGMTSARRGGGGET